MQAAHSARQSPALIGLWPAWSGLTGCAEGAAQGLGVWVFVSSAMLLVAALAYRLGRARERQRNREALHEARSAWRAATQLNGGWSWQTDGQHALVGWQAPGAPPASSCALFGPAAPVLAEHLRGQRAFADLHLRLAAPLHGAVHWVLSGVPVHDAQGRFGGFMGQARPADAEDLQAQTAAALAPLLRAYPAPAAVLVQCRGSWALLAGNPLAADQWPALGIATPAAVRPDTAGPVPPAQAVAGVPGLADALAAAGPDTQPGRTLAGPGWSACCLGPMTDGVPGLLVTGEVASPPTAPASAAAAEAPAAASTADSDNFSFTVSHDLRAPIRVVEGFTRIVKEDYGRLLDRVGNDHLDRVLGAAARMNLMIDALLTLARLSSQPLARQPVNLSQLAQYVMDDLRRASPEREAEVDIEPGLVAQGDPTLLRLVLENLLGNAWKYSAKVPLAQISLRRVPHENGLAYAVRDNGAGFDMRSADRLFGLFQRLHSASEFAGTGVGLASVRRIVQRHGGQIWAEAEVGRGACFYFTLAG